MFSICLLCFFSEKNNLVSLLPISKMFTEPASRLVESISPNVCLCVCVFVFLSPSPHMHIKTVWTGDFWSMNFSINCKTMKPFFFYRGFAFFVGGGGYLKY